MSKPIKSQKEYDEVFEKQAKMISENLNITLDQAKERLVALLKSGIIESGHPDDPVTILMIDLFLTNDTLK